MAPQNHPLKSEILPAAKGYIHAHFCIVTRKICSLMPVGGWPFPLLIQFNTHPFVFITVSHKNTPNTGCPVLGVHIRKTNKSALHFINEVAGKSRLYIIFLLLVQMVLGISSVFYAMLLRGLIDGAVAHDSKKMLTFCVLFVALVVGQIALRAVLRRIR